MINALFVETNGIYFKDPEIIAFDITKNAFTCKNGLPAICHPPCKRWGRYWSGGPSAKTKKLLGDDNMSFAFCLWYVRHFGGVIEHPEGSHAFNFYGLKKPKQTQGWVIADNYGGFVCSVAQGNYGHRARKMTWLYANKANLIDLNWSIPNGMMRLDEGRVKLKRGHAGFVPKKRISQKERLETPESFKNVLKKIARLS